MIPLKIKHTFLVLSLCLVFGSLIIPPLAYSGTSHLPHGIAVAIQPSKNAFSDSDSLTVVIRYTNISQSPIRFLMRDTALENEINEDFLTITYKGQQLAYTGRHAKRLPPTDNEYVLLQPNQSLSGTVDLALAYPIFEKGTYTITYKGVALSFGVLNSAAALELSQDRPIQAFARTPSIDPSCNATQRSQINQALGIAESIAISARNALRNAPVELRPNARRYTEWFGQFSSGRYATAQTAFDRIASALSNQVIGFDCTCNINNRENVFAFVFANDPFNMNVCPVFFRVAPSGTDSRSGTIIHEISHFNVVIGSDDFQSALNQSGSRQLALSNPSAAIRNANAFEYFAENTPFLAMPTINDLPSSADLVVNAISTTDQNPIVEEFVGVNAVVTNIGESQSSATQVSLRLSNDPQISTNDLQITQASVPALNSGASFNFQTNFQAPANAGQFYVGVCVAAISGETTTANNCSNGVPLLVDPLPADLIVSAISTSDQNPTVEGFVSLTGIISNIGDSTSPSTQANLRLSDDATIASNDLLIEELSVPTLVPGEDFNLLTDFQAPSEDGQFWIGICVAPVIDEITTNNNCSLAVPLLVEQRIIIAPLLELLLGEKSE